MFYYSLPFEEYILSLLLLYFILKFNISMCALIVIEFMPDGLSYYPILYFNDYWNLNQDYMPVNSSTKSVSLRHFLCYLCWFLKLNFSQLYFWQNAVLQDTESDVAVRTAVHVPMADVCSTRHAESLVFDTRRRLH